jgi:hypothetical protein
VLDVQSPLGGRGLSGIGVITVLPVFPYSRQPDVPYVRPDTPLANAPAMLFKDSFTVSSAPNTPAKAELEKSEGLKTMSRPNGPIDNLTASAHLTDRSAALGGSGAAPSIYNSWLAADCRKWNERPMLGRDSRDWKTE